MALSAFGPRLPSYCFLFRVSARKSRPVVRGPGRMAEQSVQGFERFVRRGSAGRYVGGAANRLLRGARMPCSLLARRATWARSARIQRSERALLRPEVGI